MHTYMYNTHTRMHIILYTQLVHVLLDYVIHKTDNIHSRWKPMNSSLSLPGLLGPIAIRMEKCLITYNNVQHWLIILTLMYGGTFRLGAAEEELLEGVVCCDYSTLFSWDSKSSILLLVRRTSDNIAIKCCCMDWLGVLSVLVDGDFSDTAELGVEGVDLTLLVVFCN